MSAVVTLLSRGEITLVGQLTDASNLALLSTVELDGVQARAMYKPVQGERPLWDFPDGTLAAREVAAFVLSDAGGWNLVPPTVLRTEGPAGPGSLQLWIGDPEAPVADMGIIDVVRPADLKPGWLPVFDAQLANRTRVVVAHADRPDLAAAAVFDAVANNADRKGSHLILDDEGSLWGFDHGVSFHTDTKLRTVLWGWAGEPLPAVEQDRLRALDPMLEEAAEVGATLVPLLTRAERQAVRNRVRRLIARAKYPRPHGDWPAVPWPPL